MEETKNVSLHTMILDYTLQIGCFSLFKGVIYAYTKGLLYPIHSNNVIHSYLLHLMYSSNCIPYTVDLLIPRTVVK